MTVCSLSLKLTLTFQIQTGHQHDWQDSLSYQPGNNDIIHPQLDLNAVDDDVVPYIYQPDSEPAQPKEKVTVSTEDIIHHPDVAKENVAE